MVGTPKKTTNKKLLGCETHHPSNLSDAHDRSSFVVIPWQTSPGLPHRTHYTGGRNDLAQQLVECFEAPKNAEQWEEFIIFIPNIFRSFPKDFDKYSGKFIKFGI